MATGRSQAIGHLLRHYRRQAGLTQEQLAECAQLSVRAISDLEAGRREPRLDTLQRLVAALPLTPEERSVLSGARESAAFRHGQILPPLVGRDEALAHLARHLAGGGRPLLLVTGEPGIGKTRLLQEAARLAVGGGFTVLTAGSDRLGGEPYASLRQMLRAFTRAQDPTLLPGYLEGCA